MIHSANSEPMCHVGLSVTALLTSLDVNNSRGCFALRCDGRGLVPVMPGLALFVQNISLSRRIFTRTYVCVTWRAIVNRDVYSFGYSSNSTSISIACICYTCTKYI